MYARHRLDLDAFDVAAAARALARGNPPAIDVPGMLPCLSVRSGFHLLLEALRLPQGTEVAFSALTHPDMPQLARHHGLVPVPIDLDPETLAPEPASLAAAVTGRTRLVVVAHLFGGLVDLGPVLEAAAPRGALVVEDCAQAYAGPGYEGDPRAAVSMFSFGLLKTATALGGALLCVRDGRLRQRMIELQAAWPVQDRRAYAKRVALAAAFLAGGRPAPYGMLAGLHSLTGRDWDRRVNGAVRAFRAPSIGDLVRHLEQRPSASLGAVLEHRRRTFDDGRLARRSAAGELASTLLRERGIGHPGSEMLRRTHWLFPVVSAEPEILVARARAAGFDAARAASNLAVVPAPASHAERPPRVASSLLAGLVYLPMYPEIPEPDRRRLVGVVSGHLPRRQARVAVA